MIVRKLTSPFIITVLILLLNSCHSVTSATNHAVATPVAGEVVVARATTQPPELPNLLLLTTATVEVRRLDSLAFVPIPLGAEVQPGDVLRLVQGEAAIFCGAEADWERNPLTLSSTENSGVPCGVGRPPRPYPDAAIVRGRGGEDRPSASEIYILSPRSGWVLNDRPALVWHEIAGAANYTVTLESDDGITRTIVAVNSPLPYPAAWEPLQAAGASYRLIVAAGDKASGGDTPGFSLLEDQDEFKAKVERLQQRVSTEPARTLLLAELYLSRSLRSEAVDLLAALPDADQIIVVQSILGETYLNMGLVVQGQAAYTHMLDLAQKQSFVESQAQALVGLGFAACAAGNFDAVTDFWSQARDLFEQYYLTTQAETASVLLAETNKLCH